MDGSGLIRAAPDGPQGRARAAPDGPRVRAALREAGGLVLPVDCAGCGRWDVPLCGECAAVLAADPARCEAEIPLLAGTPVWSLGAYTGVLRALVLGWKTHRRTDVAPALLAAAARAARAWAADPALRAALTPTGTGATGPPPGGWVLVVPAPSGWRRRLTHRLVVADLADAVARGLVAGLADGGPSRVAVVDLLRRRGGTAHQSGRGVRERAVNRRSGIRALAAVPPGTVAVVVDDVVTTGATLAACVAALVRAGAAPRAAFVLAATPPPGSAPAGADRSAAGRPTSAGPHATPGPGG